MTPQKQTIFSSKQDPTKGNCFSACIASVTDHPVTKVPVFSQIKDHKTRINETAKFLDTKGYSLAAVWDNPPKDWHQKYKGVNGFAIVGGKSPRGSEYRHAVIYKNGKPYFDPHPANTFLNGEVDRVYIIESKENSFEEKPADKPVDPPTWKILLLIAPMAILITWLFYITVKNLRKQ